MEPVLASDADADHEAELEDVRTRLDEVRRSLREDVEAHQELDARLRDSEERVARVSLRLARIRDERTAAEHRLAALRIEQDELAAAIAAERVALAGQLKAAWMSGRQERLELILNQQDPAMLGRVLIWHGYLNRLRAQRIGSIAGQLEGLERVEAALARERERLSGLESDRAQELARLEAARRERARSLAALDARIAGRGSEVARLEAQEQALVELIETLRRALAELPVSGEEPFSARRGQLQWPVAGNVVEDYGEPRAGGRLKWHGVMLGAKRGAPVEAIYYGRVAYADWLPGLGLLLVIEHGDGYMSLYAHNEVLLKSVGDWVAPREVIATVGDSGGRAAPALYFEIRREREPLDPHGWIGQATPGGR